MENNLPEKKELDLNRAIVPLSELTEKYPFFFVVFHETYPDVTKWDQHFILDSQLNPPLTLRQIFAKHGYFMEIKKSAIVGASTGKILSDTKFEVKVLKNNKTDAKDRGIYENEGDITILISAVICCIKMIEEDLLNQEDDENKNS